MNIKRVRLFISFFILVICIFAIITVAQAAVTILSFEGRADLIKVEVDLFWATGSELDFAGFYIQRSLYPDHGFARIVNRDGQVVWYPAMGEGGSGAQYNHVDTEVVYGQNYYYKLEIIDLANNSSFYDVVVNVFLGSTPTPTPTWTVTPTASATSTSLTTTPSSTRTATVPTSTRTKTRHPTITLTRTSTPFHAVTFTSRPRPTSTLSETPTETPTPTISPTETTTLIPLPSLTLEFFIHTNTPTFTASFTATSSPIPPTPTLAPKPKIQISMRDGFLGGIIILLWISLAGFLIMYIRKSTQ